MGKLFQFKRWLTLSEAAHYLSLLIGGGVSIGDVLRLGIDGHLTLSVRFVNSAKASLGKAIPIEEARHRVVPTLDGQGVIDLLEGVLMRGGQDVVVFDPSIVGISDLWDLTMIGAERLDAERLFQAVTVGAEVEMVNLDGPILRGGGLYCRLMTRSKNAKPRPPAPGSLVHPDDYYPSSGLPDDSEIVVRPQALREFESLIDETETETETEPPVAAPTNVELPLGQRERTTLLLIVAALAELAKVDVRKPSSAAAAVEAQTERMGARVAARTIEGHLHRISDALERRR